MIRDDTHLCFLFDVGAQKLRDRDENKPCPFCDRAQLAEVLDERGPILLVRNKFPTLLDTSQTVLIETDDCDAHISSYSAEHMRELIGFGIDRWIEMERSGRYRSVVFYKNHGPMSGGSIDHAHMQIVGLDKIDYKKNLTNDIFEGIAIHKDGDCSVNISTKPRGCATEMNIITRPRDDAYLARAIQTIVKYVLEITDSYNIFFFDWNDSIICKVVPRWITSPYQIGYQIPQTTNLIPKIAQTLRTRFENGVKP